MSLSRLARLLVAFSVLAVWGCGAAEKPASPVAAPSAPPPEPAPPTEVRAPASDAAAPSPLASAEAPPPPVVADPLPPADYKKFDDIVSAKSKAKGKVAQLRVRREAYTSWKRFTAVPCVDKPTSGALTLHYKPEQRDWVRAMDSTPHDACATVTFKITAIYHGDLVEGAITHIGTIAPRTLASAPGGGDYASLDDALVDGPVAKGKTVVAKIRARVSDPKEVWVFDCEDKLKIGAFVWVLPKTPAQASRVAQLPSDGTCTSAHILIVDPIFPGPGKGETIQRPLAEIVSIP